MAAIAPNYDEAAALAVESISSLDNLPNEVQHILHEISHLERKCQDLQAEIARDQRRYIRDVVRPSSVSLSLSPGAELIGALNGTSGATSPKTHLPPRIALAYAEVDGLSAEKIQLAERLIQLLTRTQTRLDADVIQVRTLQGESMADIRRSALPLNSRLEPSISGNLSAAAQVGDSLRKVLEGVSPSDPTTPFALTPPATSISAPPNKKRRLTTQTSVKVTAPPQTAPSSTYARSRPARKSQNKVSLEEPDEEDLDAEGEEEYEGEEGEEDPTPYCFCQRRSFGVMIGCDNPDCTYQWFHITCVGVKEPLPEKWYCSDCIKHKGGPEKRKGRKK